MITAGLAPLVLVAARLGGLAIFAPVYGSPVIVGRIKIFLFLGLAVVSLPVLMASGALEGASELTMWSLMAAIMLEIAVGALIGFIALIPLLAMQTGGLIMAQQMGLGFARFYNPAMGDEADVLENLLFLLALVTFISLGGIDWTALAVLNSYQYIAVGAFDLDWSIAHMLSGLIMAAFEIGMRVAAPLLALVFLETIAIGFISKTVPQLNILSLGFPLRIMIGLTAIIAGVVVLERVLVQFIDVVLDVMMSWYSGGGIPVG
jgi:flagellar biosynthetic protein FliR